MSLGGGDGDLSMTALLAAVTGLLVGSFLTVVIDRVPRGASIVAPGSACSGCHRRLRPIELVPVLSWLLLRGKCRRCGVAIGVEAVVVEIVTALLFVVMMWHFERPIVGAAHCVLVAGLVALTAIDFRTKRLPREITYTTIAVGTPLLTIAALVIDEPRRVPTALLGAFIATVIMLVLYTVSRGGLGDGDVRLSPLLGLYLGWSNPGLSLVGLFYGFIIGSVAGVALMITGRAGRRTALPFGPFLAMGTLVALLQGQSFIDVVMAR